MTKYAFPDSLKYYYGGSEDSQPEEIPAIQTAVKSLVDSLGERSSDKHSKSEMSFSGMDDDQVWDAMRQYNSALFLAAQTRFDYIDLLFEVWNRTFGDSDWRELGEEWYNPIYSISEMWTNRYINLDIYRNGSSDNGGRSESFAVEEREVGHLFLTVTRWKEDYMRIDFDTNFKSKKWIIEQDPYGKGTKWAVTTSGANILSLANGFDRELKPLVDAAREMVEFLKENRM